MRKSELLQKFAAFFQQPNIQEKGELELAHYLNKFLGEIRNEHTNDSIIQALPRYMVAAMKCLREETKNPEVTMFRQLYLVARGQQEVPDLAIPSRDRETTINLVSRIMGKVTQDIAVEQAISSYLRTPAAYNVGVRIPELQFDGLYRTASLGNEDYLRFYQDGTVLKAGTSTQPSTVEQFARFLGKNFEHCLRAQYTLLGAQITFTTVGKDPRATVCDYTGKVVNDHKIHLEIYNHATKSQESNDYDYQQVANLLP